jgi:hypothetical protein
MQNGFCSPTSELSGPPPPTLGRRSFEPADPLHVLERTVSTFCALASAGIIVVETPALVRVK